jgi:hypothetical protein
LAAPVTTATAVYAYAGVPSSLYAADANGDGKLDAVSYMGWAAGDGTGHFASVVPWPELVPDPDGGQLNVAGFAIADFDGDGLPDVARVVAQYPSNPYLTMSVGTAKGAFAAPQKLATPGADIGGWIAAAKVNGDSFVDLIAATGNGPVVLLGDGHGTFVASTPLDLGNGQPELGDFDGDGKLDIAQALNGDARVAFGDGSGGFGVPVTTPSASYWVNDALVPGDFNGDGKADLAGTLVTPDYTSFWPSLILSKGSTFGAQQALRNTDASEVPPPVQTREFAIYSGDLNGDGHADLVWLGYDVRNQWSIQSYLMGVRR